MKLITIDINTGNHPPIALKPYTLPTLSWFEKN